MGTHGAVGLTTENGHECWETTLDGYCVVYNMEPILRCLMEKKFPPLCLIGTSVHETGKEREHEQEYYIGVDHVRKQLSIYSFSLTIGSRKELNEFTKTVNEILPDDWEFNSDGDCPTDAPCQQGGVE